METDAGAARSKVTVLLDEQLLGLKDGLRDAGLKVITLDQGMPDDKIIELAEGWAILTKNSKRFLEDAVAGDYDVISLEKVRFIDDDKTRKNQTVKKITHAIRNSGLYTKKGNFHLDVHDDGTFTLTQLTV
jgi:hypothetical protein